MDAKQSPKPPIAVGGWGSPSIPLNRTIRGSINYQYPPDFPEDSRTPIKREEIRAARELTEKSKDVSERDLRVMLLACAMRPALAFALEMIRIHWGADRIDSQVRDFIRGSLVWAGLPPDTNFEASAEWRRYQDELLGAPVFQGPPPAKQMSQIELISANMEARAEARAHEEYLVEKIKSELRMKDSLTDSANLMPDLMADLQEEVEVSISRVDLSHNQHLGPKTLRDLYIANFSNEKIKILDMCWAAGQHYREWKRWFAGELKAGSTPDLAFRKLLLSGIRPSEYKSKPRPKRWE